MEDSALPFRVWEGNKLVFAYDPGAKWCKENVVVGKAKSTIKPNALYVPLSCCINAS